MANFISFEGGEGSGKSTQLSLLEKSFEASGLPFLKTREPGGSENGKRIRALLVSGDHEPFDPLAETLLFYADRLEHVNKLVKPALKAGTHVICDRFADSTLVYQGIGKGLSEEAILQIHRQLLGNFGPDLTLILDIDPKIGLQRAGARQGHENRFESLPLDFHQKVRAGFLSIAEREPRRCVVIDASADAKDVQKKIVATINERLGLELA